jgi:hypothetical protein
MAALIHNPEPIVAGIFDVGFEDAGIIGGHRHGARPGEANLHGSRRRLNRANDETSARSRMRAQIGERIGSNGFVIE